MREERKEHIVVNDKPDSRTAGSPLPTNPEIKLGYKSNRVNYKKAEEAADKVLASSYKESEANSGKKEFSKKLKETTMLESAVSLSRIAERSIVIDRLYNNSGTINTLQTALQRDVPGLKTALSHGNVVKDFEINKRALENYLLHNHRVDVSKMTYKQINKAIRSGELRRKFSSTSIHLKDAKLIQALQLMSQYKQMEPAISALKAKGTSTTGNIAKSVTNTVTTQEGEVSSGLQMVKTGKRTAGGVVLVGRAAANAQIVVGVHAANAYTRLFSNEAKAIRRFKAENKDIKKLQKIMKLSPNDLSENGKQLLENFQRLQGAKFDKIWDHNQLRLETRRHPIQYFVAKPINFAVKKISGGKYDGMADFKKQALSKIEDKLFNRHTIVDGKRVTMMVKNAAGQDVVARKPLGKLIDSLNAGKIAIVQLKQKMAQSTAMKIIGAPFKVFGGAKALAGKLLLAVGGIFLIIALVSVIGSAAASVISIFPNVETESGEGVNDVLQKTVNKLQKTQVERFTNLINCTKKSTTPIYPKWKLCISDDSSNSLNKSPVAIYKGGSLVGYNLNYYHGAVNRIYTDYITVGTWNKGHWSDVVFGDLTIKVWTPGFWTYSQEQMTIVGQAGLNGNLGTFTSKTVTLSTSTSAYKRLEKKKNDGVFFQKMYYGSTSMDYDSANHATYCDIVKDDNSVVRENHSDYSIYKNTLSMAYGFTQNSEESFDYYYKYCQSVVDSVFEKAKIVLSVSITPSSTKTVSWTYRDKSGAITHCSARGYDLTVSVDMIVDDCDIYNMMTHDKTDNIAAHVNSKGLYKITDPSDEGYVYWDGWFHHNGVSGQKAFNDNSELTRALLQLKDEEWNDLFYNIAIPGR